MGLLPALFLWFLPTLLHIVTLFNRAHDAVLVGNMMTQLFFLLLQPNQLERSLEVITTAHPALDHCIFLGERVGRPLQAKSSLNLFCLDLLQRGSMSLLPALALPVFHLFGGTVLVTDLLILG